MGESTGRAALGAVEVLEDAGSHKVKRIEVRPGHRLSYQWRSRRAEHWFVISGLAAVTLDGEIAEVSASHAIDIPQWDENLYSIEAHGADPGYFVNHSCDPNLWFQDPFTLVARRPIRTGQEVTLDYALMESDPPFVAAWECRCGSSHCRRVITGRDWQDPDVQLRYEGHFTPLITKRIATRS